MEDAQEKARQRRINFTMLYNLMNISYKKINVCKYCKN